MSDENLYANEDHMWQTHMQTLMKRKKNLQIARIIDEAIGEYYSLHGKNVPEWKRKDPDWWTRYLISLEINPTNA
jgi:hypothetical protein